MSLHVFNPNFPIKKTIKLFDNLTWDDFAKSNAKKLHLFSNILDVKAFDLAKFIHLFQQSFQGENFFICVGPYYSNNHRVDEFIAATNPDITFANVDKESGAWKDAWTISMRVFFKDFQHIESIENIGKRIEESQKKNNSSQATYWMPFQKNTKIRILRKKPKNYTKHFQCLM